MGLACAPAAAAGQAKAKACRQAMPLDRALPCRLLWGLGKSCRSWAACTVPAGRGGGGGSSITAAGLLSWQGFNSSDLHRSRKSLSTSSLLQNSLSVSSWGSCSRSG